VVGVLIWVELTALFPAEYEGAGSGAERGRPIGNHRKIVRVMRATIPRAKT